MNLTYNTHSWDDDQMLTAHAVLVAQLVGSSKWAALDYQTDITALVAWLSVLEAQASKRTVTAVMEEIQALPLNDLLKTLTE